MPHIPGHNFAGPGTDILKQLKSGKFPTNALDFYSLLHDKDYGTTGLSTNDADQKYIDNLDNVSGPLARLIQLGFKGKQFIDDKVFDTDTLLRPDQHLGNYASCLDS